MARKRIASTPKKLRRSEYVPGPSYAATLWDEDWLRAHTWHDPAEPDAPAVGEFCVTGAAGTGKTRNILEWFHYALLTHPHARVLLAREFRADLTQSAMKAFEKEVLPEGTFGDAMSDAPIRFHGGQQAYLYPNGSELVVKGLRDGHGIYSQQYDGIIVNEAGAGGIFEEDWDQLKRALRNNKMPWQILVGDMNPEFELHWLHQRCDDGATVEIATTHADNPSVTSGYLHHLATMRDPNQRARLFEGKRVSYRPGAYYQDQLAKARLDGRIGKVPHQKGVPVFTSWDLGWTDYTAIWFLQRVRGEWHWIDYYENHQQELDHYAAVLSRKTIERQFVYGQHYFPHDASHKTLAAGGQSVAEQLGRMGVRGVTLPASSEQAQVNATRLTLDASWFDNETWVKPQDGDTAREGVRWGLQRLAGFHAAKDERLDVFKPSPVHDLNSHGAKAFTTGVLADPQNESGGFNRPGETEAAPWERH